MDLLLLLALAGFLIYKMFSVMGQDLGGNTDAFSSMTSKHKPQNKKQLENVDNKTSVENVIVFKSNAPSTKSAKVTAKIVAKDASFVASDFLTGAQSCFSSVLKSFAKNEKLKLKDMLAPKIFNVFSKEIDRRQKLKIRAEEKILRFKETNIISSTIKGDIIDITVNFVSDKISVIFDSEGRILEGHPRDITTSHDVWVFTRNMASKNSNWYLKETN